jgi:aldehyde dehydrogenase family 7 protein A1
MPLISKLKSKIIVKPVDLHSTTKTINEILSGLGLPADKTIIPGVFNGKWGGNGPVIESVDPSTNKTISKIQSVLKTLETMLMLI